MKERLITVGLFALIVVCLGGIGLLCREQINYDRAHGCGIAHRIDETGVDYYVQECTK